MASTRKVAYANALTQKRYLSATVGGGSCSFREVRGNFSPDDSLVCALKLRVDLSDVKFTSRPLTRSPVLKIAGGELSVSKGNLV